MVPQLAASAETPNHEQWVAPHAVEGLAESAALGWIGLLPALAAIVLCFATRRPLIGLAAGLAFAFLLYFTTTENSASHGLLVPPWRAIALLTALLLSFGALMGLWQFSGALPALMDRLTRRTGKHPNVLLRTTWLLGVLLFQGGGLSAFLVGSSVREPARRVGLRPVQTAYVVDSTSAPIAMLFPLNAWFFYLSGLLGVVAIPALADPGVRALFIVHSLPVSFFCMSAVAIAGLYAMGWHRLGGAAMASKSGEVNVSINPISIPGLSPEKVVPVFYTSIIALILSLIPVVLLLGFNGLPAAAVIACGVGATTAKSLGWSWRLSLGALLRGALVILLPVAILAVAMSLGSFTRALGIDTWLQVSLIDWPWVWLFPVAVFLGSSLVSLATGTSWGSLAILIPALLPVAAGMGEVMDPSVSYAFLLLSYAAMVNGAIFGDLCSPLSDTTILSSSATGCDIIDHVRTQWFPSCIAALVACLLWAACSAILFR